MASSDDSSVTRALAAFAASTSYDSLPPGVAHDTKRIILDALGCALGGYSMAESRVTIDVVQASGGEPESTVVGSGRKLPAPWAAYANAKLGNLMDMDDVFYNIGHQSPVVMFPALAVAERVGATGKELIAACAVGFDVASRVVLGLGSIFEMVDEKPVPADTTGFGHAVFGGAVAAGKLLGLATEGMANALGIAGLHTPAPLSHKSVTDMTMSKYQLEWAAAGGTLAALLAQRGQQGPQSILDDDFYAKALAKKRLMRDEILADIGDRWYISETSIKPYPHCRHTHYALDAFAHILREHDLNAGEIEIVTVTGFANYTIRPWNNHSPSNVFEGQFSLPYAMSLIALGVPPGPKWMDPSRLEDPEVRRFADKVRTQIEPRTIELTARSLPRPLKEAPTTVEVKARGKTFSHSISTAKGDGFSKTSQMCDEEVVEKFRENASYTLTAERSQALVELVFDLEHCDDARALGIQLGA